METGDKVLFVMAHPNMNRRLKEWVGETGVVKLKGEDANQKVLVWFTSWEQWWISPSLLTRIYTHVDNNL